MPILKQMASLASFTATVATPTPGDNDPATNEVQTITLDTGVYATGGTFTITYAGQTTGAIAYNASAATILTALEALSNIEAGHVSVSGTLNTGITITFGAVVTITASVAETVQGSAGPATDEIQTVSLGVDQVATGGTFTLTYSGQTTSAIAYGASAATIQTALEALSNLAPGDVSVAGTLNTDIVITFGGTLAATNVDAMTVSVASTTGVSALSATDVAAVTVSIASTTFSTVETIASDTAFLSAVTLTGGSDAATLTVRADSVTGSTLLVVKAAINTTVAVPDLHRSQCSGGIHAALAGTAASASFVYE